MIKKLGICDECNKPVTSDQLRYTLLEPDTYRHADCHRTTGDIIKGMHASIDKMKSAISCLKSRVNRFDK